MEYRPEYCPIHFETDLIKQVFPLFLTILDSSEMKQKN